MFTGIVQGTAELVAIKALPNFRTHVIRMPSLAWGEGLALGASVAHNGCCLTVTRVEGDLVSFDLIQETLRLTNLGTLQAGDKVNVERAARFGDEIGGHTMSGHIMGTAEVISVIDTPNNRQVWYRLAPTLMKYVLTKGYIGIDGISLTRTARSGTRSRWAVPMARSCPARRRRARWSDPRSARLKCPM